MGRVGFLSFLFRKKEPKKATVAEADLYDWFLDISQDQFFSIKEDLRRQFGEIEQHIADTRGLVSALEAAKLQNENIPSKASQVMQGNREANVRMTRVLLDAIQPPIEITMEATKQFIADFEEQMSQYQKSSAKSHYILQEFFANEAGAVRAGIRKIDSSVRNLLKNEYEDLLTLKKTIITLGKTKRSKADIQRQIGGLQREQKLAQKDITDTRADLDAYLKSPEYKSLLELYEQEGDVKGRLEKQHEVLKTFFSDIDRALRKFVHIERSEEKIVDAYLADPFAAIANDPVLQIVDVCQRTARAIRADLVDLKDREKETALARLDEATAKFFITYKQALHILGESAMDIGRRIRNHRASAKQGDLDYRLTHLGKKSEAIEEQIADMQRKLESMQTDDYLDVIRDETKRILQIDLEITPGTTENDDIEVVR